MSCCTFDMVKEQRRYDVKEKTLVTHLNPFSTLKRDNLSQATPLLLFLFNLLNKRRYLYFLPSYEFPSSL